LPNEYRIWKYGIRGVNTTGTTQDQQYKRLSKDIVKRYIKVVNFIKAARRIEDLFLIKSLHYEKKKGDLNGVDAVWINEHTACYSQVRLTRTA